MVPTDRDFILLVGVITLTALTGAQGRSDVASLAKIEASGSPGETKVATAKKATGGAVPKKKE